MAQKNLLSSATTDPNPQDECSKGMKKRHCVSKVKPMKHNQPKDLAGAAVLSTITQFHWVKKDSKKVKNRV